MQKQAIRIAAFCLALLSTSFVPVSGQTFDSGATVQPSLQPPTASIQGVQPWDPYADAAAAAVPPPVYAPQDPFQSPQPTPYGYPGLAQPMRLLQSVGIDYTHLGSNGSPHLGLDEFEFHSTFALPIGYQLAPIEITPGFAIQLWDGPESPSPSFPPRTFSSYIDFGWRPQVTEWFSAELAVRPGLYSDFREADSDAFRIKGKGLAIFTPNPTWAFVAGVLYLDRVDVKLLPAGGVIWTPTPDVRYELIFPQPKLAARLTTIGNTEWWWYLGGEYGGDSWSVATTGGRTQTDYNDIRVYGGLEFKPCGSLTGISGRLELGYVFDRELVFDGIGTTKPEDTYMLRASIAF